MVAEHDLELDLVHVRRNLLEVDLLALGDDVEGVADLDVDGFVLRRVCDPILADKLQAALRVCLVDADHAGRHRHPEPGLRLVLELIEHLHIVLERRAGVVCVAVVERLPVDDVAFIDGDTGAFEQADLLGLVVVDGRRSPHRVEVVVREALLGHQWHGVRQALTSPVVLEHPAHRPPDPIQVAGHELQRRVAERRAATVGQRDPAVEIGGLVVAAHCEDVVRVPFQAAREVRRLDPVVRGAGVVERPDERRARVQVAGQRREADVIGAVPRDNLAVDLPHRLRVVAEEPRGDGFFARGAVLLDRSHERDVPADVLPEQLFGIEQVVLVVLLEDAEPRGLGQRSEVHGRRVDGGSDVHEPQVERPTRNPKVPHVADERDVRVVDGQRQADLIVDGRLPTVGLFVGSRLRAPGSGGFEPAGA